MCLSYVRWQVPRSLCTDWILALWLSALPPLTWDCWSRYVTLNTKPLIAFYAQIATPVPQLSEMVHLRIVASFIHTSHTQSVGFTSTKNRGSGSLHMEARVFLMPLGLMKVRSGVALCSSAGQYDSPQAEQIRFSPETFLSCRNIHEAALVPLPPSSTWLLVAHSSFIDSQSCTWASAVR
jgi:hypothetical protein